MVQRSASQGGWVNGPVTLCHGTTDGNAHRVLAGVDVRHGMARREFGSGFYTTTSLDQATEWADRKA
ncbi:MAG: DUF3990 domain-containing protein [Dehalococcoidia bacterium]|nr:DUF3990 domain-containing protein [Dehalococcoidia bacterium]